MTPFQEASQRLIMVVGLVGAMTCCNSYVASAQGWPEWTVVNVAHRGGIVSGLPENTITTYRRAISLGVDVLEIDLRGTRDG